MRKQAKVITVRSHLPDIDIQSCGRIQIEVFRILHTKRLQIECRGNTSTDGSFVYGYAVATDTGIAVQDGRILVDLFYETYAESVINGAINVNVYVVG